MIIYEVTFSVQKQSGGKFARWLPGHVRRVLESPGFRRARVLREKQPDAESKPLRWTIQYEVADETALVAYFAERAPALRIETEREFGAAVHASRRTIDRVELIEPTTLDGGLPMRDFPKVGCPFIRQTFRVDVAEWKKHGRRLQLREPRVYLAVNRVNPGYEWVFEDEDTIAVEKLHGTNVKVLLEGGRILAIQNRKNLVDPLEISRGQTFIMEALLQAAARDRLPCDGEHAGEVIGPKLQGNPYQLDVHEWFAFERSISELRYRSFNEHARTYENLSSWFKDYLHSRFFMKRARKAGTEEKIFAEGVIFYNLRRRAEKMTWMAKLRRDMFPWYYEPLAIPDFDPAGRDELEDQELMD